MHLNPLSKARMGSGRLCEDSVNISKAKDVTDLD